MMEAKELSIFEAYNSWPDAEPQLHRAVYGADPEGYVRRVQAAVFAGINSLWKIGEKDEVNGYAITSLYTVDGLNKVAQVHLMTVKDMEEVVPLIDYFTIWAKKHNADWVEVIGRKGWERMLKPYGFNHEYTSLLKRVEETH